MATNNSYSFLEGTVVRKTDAAVLFKPNCHSSAEWFPLSQISELHETGDKGEDSMKVADWILNKKGIEV